MKRLNMNELERLRKGSKECPGDEITISMGTCGIAAGGDEIYHYFEKEIEKRGLTRIHLKRTGCLGLCYIEPNVIVKIKDLPAILYGPVNKEVAVRIMEEHVSRSQILHDYVVAMPSEDIYCKD